MRGVPRYNMLIMLQVTVMVAASNRLSQTYVTFANMDGYWNLTISPGMSLILTVFSVLQVYSIITHYFGGRITELACMGCQKSPRSRGTELAMESLKNPNVCPSNV